MSIERGVCCRISSFHTAARLPKSALFTSRPPPILRCRNAVPISQPATRPLDDNGSAEQDRDIAETSLTVALESPVVRPGKQPSRLQGQTLNSSGPGLRIGADPVGPFKSFARKLRVAGPALVTAVVSSVACNEPRCLLSRSGARGVLTSKLLKIRVTRLVFLQSISSQQEHHDVHGRDPRGDLAFE